ncbi:helix-turn-helix domain-containing protein [Acidimicrobiaceae bacterium AH-315-P05]|nr:helix-turn-helix domain-containing protein [Acidimicrobiaceae bacterium AH-315-P05]
MHRASVTTRYQQPNKIDLNKAKQLHEAGHSWEHIAQTLGVARSTLRRARTRS